MRPMQRRGIAWLGLVLLLAVAGLGLAIGLSSSPPPPVAEDLTTTEPDSEAQEPADADLVASGAVVDTTGDDPADDAADEVQRQEAAAADANRGARVTVVRGNPPTPVAAASVFFVPPAMARQRLLDHDRWPQAAWPVRVGQRAETTGDGIVHLPAGRSAWLVAASHDGQFAFAEVSPWQRQVTLTLATDETVRVQVRQPDGSAAAGLPVALVQRRGNDEPRAFWRTTTGPDGLAEVPHFQTVRPDRPGDGRETFHALLKLPVATPIGAPFAARPAQRETIELTAPWLGTVDVLVADHRGTPILSRGELHLSPDGQPADGAMAIPRFETALRADKPLGAGPVRFSFVPAQAALRATARFAYEFGRPTAVSTTGPPDAATPGQLELRLDPRKAVLAGRLLLRGDDGQTVPLADGRVAVIAWRADRALFELAVETIADGRFDLVLEPREGRTGDWLELRYQPKDGPPGLVFGGKAPAANLTPGERRELGDLVLAPLPPLAGGTVANDLGEPIADAQVRLQVSIRDQDREVWRDVPGSQVRSDAEGRFAMYGNRPPGQVRLFAQRDGHFEADGPLLPPGRPCALVLVRHGVVVGRVLLPGWVADGMAELQLVPDDPLLDDRGRQTATVRSALRRARGGRFWLAPLPRGSFTARIVLRGIAEPVFTAPGVFVQPGTNREPRLALVDLRNAVHRYRLTAHDAAGRRLAVDTPLLVRSRQPDGSVVSAGFRFERGRSEVIAATPSLEFVAFAPGCAPTVVVLPAGDHAVTLQQQEPALLRLPNVRALCGPQRKVRVSVVYTGDTGYPDWLDAIDQRSGQRTRFPRWELGKSSGAWLENSDTVEVPIALEGDYEVVLRVHATDRTDSPQASLPLGKHRLAVQGLRSALDVPVDQERLLAMLRQLDERQRNAEQRRAQEASANPRNRRR